MILTMVFNALFILLIIICFHYLVVRAKNLLVETETEEDEGNDVYYYDSGLDEGFRRQGRFKGPKSQNKNGCPSNPLCRITFNKQLQSKGWGK